MKLVFKLKIKTKFSDPNLVKKVLNHNPKVDPGFRFEPGLKIFEPEPETR